VCNLSHHLFTIAMINFHKFPTYKHLGGSNFGACIFFCDIFRIYRRYALSDKRRQGGVNDDFENL
jgi:hypothetical protein